MQPIPVPHVLDPNRILDNDRNDLTADHAARAALLEKALHDTCAYAQQLWDNLDAVRGYLLTSLPPDPRSPEPHVRAGASPTGPDDEAGWNNWIAAFSNVTSVLCGPHGDSGFGHGEARHAAELRRNAPNLRLSADHENLPAAARGSEPSPPVVASSSAAPASPKSQRGRAVATAVLVVLAIRGVLPRRRRRGLQ